MFRFVRNFVYGLFVFYLKTGNGAVCTELVVSVHAVLLLYLEQEK